MNDYNEILISVIGLVITGLFSVITVYVRLYFQSKVEQLRSTVDQNLRQDFDQLTSAFVQGIDNMIEMSGNEKRTVVVDLLAKHPLSAKLNLTHDEIDVLVRSAYEGMKTEKTLVYGDK